MPWHSIIRDMSTGLLVNDIHSQVNSTRVRRVLTPSSLDELVEVVRAAGAEHVQISICGGRHAMGGQQFGTDTWLIDLRRCDTIENFDAGRGLVTAGAGIQWPELIAGCHAQQGMGSHAWSIRQKQTG